mgnify:CR=1 FL=1
MARKNSNKRLIIISLVVLVVLAGAGFIGKKQGWIGKPPAKKVEIGQVKLVDIVEKVSASGKVQPVDEVALSPQVPGEIMKIYVEEGDSVRAGEMLIQIKPEQLASAAERSVATLNTQKANLSQSKARYAQTNAEFIQAKQLFERNKQLYNEKVISQQEYEQSEAQFLAAEANLEAAEQSIEAAKYTVQSAEASVKEARENLSFTNIYAPMNGIVTKLLVEEGERVVGTQQMAGTEMIRIANLNDMEVRVDVNENDIIRVSEGDTVIIDVDAYSYLDVEFTGVVSAIANSANESATASVGDAVTEFEVRIQILNESYKVLNQRDNSEQRIEPNTTPFRPGMTASVDIVTERRTNVMGVPLTAVTTRTPAELKGGGRNRGGGPDAQQENTMASSEEDLKEVVFVVKGDTVDVVEVKTGISDFDNIQILNGLEMDQQIVTGPYLMVSKTLKKGDFVESREEGEDGEKPAMAGVK